MLRKIGGRRYGAYRELLGVEQVVDGIEIKVVKVQSDPYAPPSVVKLTSRIEVPKWALEHPVALADWIYRRLFRELKKVRRKVGEGHSGYLGIPEPSPVMIRRSGVEIVGNYVIARVWVGLPSKRRRVLGEEAREILLEKLPRAFKKATDYRSSVESLRKHVDAWIEQEFIRSSLPRLGLVAFVGDGSILPREGGSQRPLPSAKPFQSPPSLRIEMELPTGRTVTGMGIPKGLTLVIGPAFHGKTTLLEALAAGVYNHVPGDGREFVVTIREAIYVSTEEGRFVTCVDVSPFIKGLPNGGSTECFTTRDASGATSVAASIQEAVEVGAKLLLLDEDTVATNILFEDPDVVKRIYGSRTVAPITSLAKSMASHGISIVIASSGSKQLLKASSIVIEMHKYLPRDVTKHAKEMAMEVEMLEESYSEPKPRILVKAPRLAKPRIRGCRLEDKSLPISIDLCTNIQLYEETQLNTLREVAKILPKYEGMSISEIARTIERTIINEGFAKLLGKEPGPDLGEVRALDAAFLINRLPIKVEQFHR